MEMGEKQPPRTERSGRLALCLAGGYVLIALAWIVLSDSLLDGWMAAGDIGLSPVHLQIAKGSGFVLVTGSLLFILIRRYLAAVEHQEHLARETLADLELAVDGSDAAVWRIDMDPVSGELLDHADLSPRSKAIIGFEPDAFPDSRKAWSERIPAEDLKIIEQAMRAHLDGHSERYRVEYRIRHRDGSLRWILSTGRIRRDSRGQPVRWVGFDWDMSRQKQDRYRIEKLSRMYAVLSHTNQAIVHITEPEELFTRVARIAVEEGGLLGCWIGLADAGAGQPRTMAVDGPVREFVERVHGVADDMSRSEDMVAQALRSGEHQIINDYDEDDSRIRHCWYAAQQAGVLASAAFPVRRAGAVVGVMALYAGEANYFDADLLGLLDEMAADLSFALDNYDRNTERARIEARLRAATEYFETLITAAPVAIAALSADGRVRLWNPAAEATFGWTRDEVIDRPLPIVPGDKQDEFAALRHEVTTGKPLAGKTLQRRRKDGSTIEVNVYAAPLRNEHGAVDGIMALLVDMTERNRIEQALRDGEARYRQLFEAYPAPLWVFDRETLRFIAVNRAAIEHYGYSRDAFLTMTIADIQPPEDMVSLREIVGRDASALKHVGLRRHVKRDGTIIDVEVIAHPLTFMDRPAAVVMAQDVTERLRAERERQLAATVFENSREAIVITDARQRIISINRAFTEITGYTLEEVRGKKPSVLASGRHDARFYEQLWKTLEADGYWQGEIWNRRKNGEVYPEWLGISVVRDQHATITHYVGIFMDITKRKEAEQRIDFLAYHDPLSGLPNRALLIDRLSQSIAHAQRTGTLFAVLFLDLDRFKTINESLGHRIGDRLLKIVAERLQGLLRDGDTVSRQGGDEFTILLSDLQRNEQIGRMAEEILTRLAEPMQIDEHRLSVTASIGISVFPHNGQDVETLLKNADAAVFHSKEDGRNTFRFFTSDMTEISRRRLDLENRLHRAIAEENFELYYQPEVEAQSGIIRGVEVLLRWHEPELGWVSPGDFIPIAEDSGLIIPLGEWILRKACREAHYWQADCSVPMPIAVNISAIQFHRADFADLVEAVLRESGLQPGLLELELTERILMGDRKSTLSTMDRLNRLGVRLAIDDFGTGYSSLSYLHRFKVDKLKVDQSFVSEMSDSADAKAIVKSIIDLAHNLQIAAVAEGVETPAQVEYLQHFGCELMQGYLLCRPLPRDRIMAFFKQGYIPREQFMGLV